MSVVENIASGGAASFCMNLARERDFPGYAAALFVPPVPRRAFFALAAFNVEVAHVRDLISQPMPGEIRLQWWRDVVTGAAQPDGNPVATELLAAVAQYELPRETLIRLIDAHVFDVYDDPMPDMAALEAHCRDTSAALFALRAKILGTDLAAIERCADHAGIAEGLVDVMTTLPKHAARRQLYLPADLLNLKDANAVDIFLHRATPQLGDVLAHLRAEASRQYDSAMTLLRDVPKHARGAFLPLALVTNNLERLARTEPFAPKQSSRLSTLWTLWRATRSQPFKA